MEDPAARISRLVEKACLNALAISLRDAGDPELSAKIAKYIPEESPEYLEMNILAAPPGFAKEPTRLRMVLASVPRGQKQETGFNSTEDAYTYVKSKRALLGAAQSWMGAFASGSPELTDQCARVLGQNADDSTACLRLLPTDSHSTAFVFRPEDLSEISVVTYVVLPNGEIRVPPVKK